MGGASAKTADTPELRALEAGLFRRVGPGQPRNNCLGAPYLGQETTRRTNPKMTTIPNKTLPDAAGNDRTQPTLPTDRWKSAQSLRPTFDGWGPRL